MQLPFVLVHAVTREKLAPNLYWGESKEPWEYPGTGNEMTRVQWEVAVSKVVADHGYPGENGQQVLVRLQARLLPCGLDGGPLGKW
jgi:hypothetical protein